MHRQEEEPAGGAEGREKDLARLGVAVGILVVAVGAVEQPALAGRGAVHGGSLAVHGPGDLFRHHAYDDGAAAMLEHASLEQELVCDGWSLERMTRASASARSGDIEAPVGF